MDRKQVAMGLEGRPQPCRMDQTGPCCPAPVVQDGVHGPADVRDEAGRRWACPGRVTT